MLLCMEVFFLLWNFALGSASCAIYPLSFLMLVLDKRAYDLFAMLLLAMIEVVLNHDCVVLCHVSFRGSHDSVARKSGA